MRIRRLHAVILAAGLLVISSAAPSGATSPDHPRHRSHLRHVALWDMNESGRTRTMRDDSGNGLHGTVGREVETGVKVKGATGYRFSRVEPDTPPTRPKHLVTVADRSALDPGDRDFAVLVRLRTTERFGNIIQKGQATVSGGNYKMQIPNGIVECLFRGSSTTVIVRSTRRLNDGRWHTVLCERTPDRVELWVDGRRDVQRYARTGRIANSWPLSIGGKTDCDQVDVGCDYYAGDLDWVQIDSD